MNKYDKSLKRKWRLAKDIGSRKAAEQLGIPFYTLIDWRSARRQHGDKAYVGSGHSYADANKSPRELELERENAELRRANEILKDALVFLPRSEEVKTRRLYGYIRGSRNRWSAEELCRVLRVSESGYYRSLKAADRYGLREHLLVRIEEIIGQYPDNDNYGARRVHLALAQAEEAVSYSTVYRVMKQSGLIRKKKRHPNGITREDAAVQKGENLIARDFTADAPNTNDAYNRKIRDL